MVGTSYKTLNLGVFLEGLYEGESTMRPAMDQSGIHWGPTIADKVTVELHGVSIPTVVYSTGPINLSTNGLATVNIPATFSGNYYLTVKNRNSVETVSCPSLSADPLSIMPSTPLQKRLAETWAACLMAFMLSIAEM